MKIQYWSDLHLEFTENIKYMMLRRIDVISDILILAGDITYWQEAYFKHPFFDKLSKKFPAVYMIPGNHEFYNSIDACILDKPFKIQIRENIFLMNNIVENINGINFFFTPLWSVIRGRNIAYIEKNINDFHLIKYHNETFTAHNFNNLYKEAFQFLDESLTKSNAKKKIVVTHHCPTQKANHPEFQQNIINDAFVVELDNFIEQKNIDYWIFGHTHRNMPEVIINSTKILSNQLGYVHLRENKSFILDKFIEL